MITLTDDKVLITKSMNSALTIVLLVNDLLCQTGTTNNPS